MLTIDAVLKKFLELQADLNAPVERINVTNRCPQGSLGWGYKLGCFSAEILMHPNDWEDLQHELKHYTNKTDYLWGLPIFITDQPKKWLSIRWRTEGVDHALEVHDDFGNKLGEVQGCRGASFHADARGHAYMTIEIRVENGALAGPSGQ